MYSSTASATWTSRHSRCMLRQLGGVDDRLAARRAGWPARKRRRISRLVGFGRVAERQAQQEAVELRLGQRERALELDRVLRRQHQERPRQRARLAVDGDLALLHRLQQRRLGARRGAVDLVGQHDLGEDRPGPELELLLASG